MLIEINGKVNWESEMRLLSVHHEPPHTDMLKKEATGYSCCILNTEPLLNQRQTSEASYWCQGGKEPDCCSGI